MRPARPATMHLFETERDERESADGAGLPGRAPWPENPILVRLWRAGHVESVHRGAWVVVDADGAVVDGQGDWNHPMFARSSTKSLQALPLVESGAAERFGITDEELALALASHHAEERHVRVVQGLLERLGLKHEHLQCGAQAPTDARARAALSKAGLKPTAVHNNCSGKHACFLALALHLGVDPARYLERENEAQSAVRRAVEELSGVRTGELSVAVDGCSAPTFRLPLARLATALARVANPEKLRPARRKACERMVRVAAAHPDLIGASQGSLCSDLLRASEGKLFPKLGAEAVYVLGVRGKSRGLALKIDDGNYRAMQPLVVELCERFGFLAPDEAARLEAWRQGPIRNWAGVEVGRTEVVA